MSKRLVLCFDGTWNTPDVDDDNHDIETNVCRFYESLASRSDDGSEQRTWYQKGVGTKWYERIRGGAFGLGLDRNIREGFKFLTTNFEDGDTIYIFGFSRGAYTARSLVGLIRNCGLLRMDKVEDRAKKTGGKGTPQELFEEALGDTTEEAYEIYRSRDKGPDSENARFFRERYCKQVGITFLGVWDTVGGLGIPLESFEEFNKERYEFHDTELSGIVQHAYHAVAVDENRKNYAVTLWAPKAKPTQTMEQRWFIGAHSDVGGGYQDRRLSDITLHWMQGKAAATGLSFKPESIPMQIEEYYKSPVTDSFRAFLRGIYARHNARYYREICQTQYGNEMVDESVRLRLDCDISYRPKNAGIPR